LQQDVQHSQEAAFLGHGGVVATPLADQLDGSGDERQAGVGLAEGELGQEQVVAGLVTGLVHLPGAEELPLGLGQVVFLQGQQAHLEPDVGVGALDLAQGGAGLGSLALALVGQGEQVVDVGVVATGLHGAVEEPGRPLVAGWCPIADAPGL
jgi:hypothetical protein